MSSIDTGDWPFQVSADTEIYTTSNVVRNGDPILTIAHDHEGDWQFLCGYTNRTEDMFVLPLSSIYQEHPFIRDFADLPLGWVAWRDSAADAWHREPMEPDA